MAEKIGYNQTFPIYGENDEPFHDLVLKTATYNSVVMSLADKISGDAYYKDNKLKCTMKEYVVLDGVRYTLVNPPTIVREGMVSDNGELKGLTKYSFEFYHPMYMLASFPFSDVAVSYDENRYKSQDKTFNWIGNIVDFVAKLNKNLEVTEWVVEIDASTSSDKLALLSEVLLFDNVSIADALKTAYDTYQLPFVITALPSDDERYVADGKRFLITFGIPSNEIYDEAFVDKDAETDVFVGSNLYVYYPAISLSVGDKIECSTKDGGSVSIYDRSTQTFFAQNVKTFVASEEIDRFWVLTERRTTIHIAAYRKHIFKFGQGLGLKNNSRTPKNNKIVTRLAGYGSEDNIPYGYPQIRWYGNPNWTNTLNDATNPYAYPIYDGILGGEYVKLIKHPYTRSHLMPSIYVKTLFNKISPVKEDGQNNPDYDPNTELIDYYEADDSDVYPNPINLNAPSYDSHEFADVKPELGEASIIDAQPSYAIEEKASYSTQGEFEARLAEYLGAADSEAERKMLAEILNAYEEYKDEFDKGEEKPNRNVTNEGGSFPYQWTMKADDYLLHFKATDPNGSWGSTIIMVADIPHIWNDNMDENGGYEQTYFEITLPILDFDLYACAAITQEMQINMRSGACIGCTFPIQVDWENYKLNFYAEDGTFAPRGDKSRRDLAKYPDSREKEITLVVQKDIDTFGTLMPNVYQQPKAGDKFVILGISLPQSYLTNAESRLDEDMKEYLLENNVYYYEYPLKFDEFFLMNYPNLLSQIRNNTTIRFEYGDSLQLALYIKEMSVKYGGKPLPQYDITLTDDVEIVLNKLGQTTEDVSRLRVQVSALQSYYDKNIAKELSEKLSRIEDDIAQGVITFQQGLASVGRAIFGDEVASSQFNSGLYDGRGWRIDQIGNAEMESLRVRSYLEVVELLINRLQAQEGDTIFSDNDQIDMVETSLFTENLLLNSDVRVENSDYLIAKYRFKTPPQVGKTYRFTIHGRLGSGRAYFRLYNSSASCLIKTMNLETEIEAGRTWQGTSPWSTTDSRGNQVPNDELWVYQYPSTATGAGVIEWIRMEEVGSETNAYILTLKEKWEGYVTSQKEGNILKGIINTLAAKYGKVSDVTEEQSVETDGENRYYTSWMRVVDSKSVGKTLSTNQIAVVLYGDEQTPAGKNFAPCELMTIARWGCDADANDDTLTPAQKEDIERRQRMFLISTTDGRITKFRGVKTPKLEQGNYGTTLGIVPDFVKNWTIASQLREGRDYLYAQGIIVGDFIKVDIDGEPLINYVDVGEWKDKTDYLHNEYNAETLQWETHDVWHNGSKWRCLQHQPVTISGKSTYYEPTAANAVYWQKLLHSGESIPSVIASVNPILVPASASGATEALFSNSVVYRLTYGNEECRVTKIVVKSKPDGVVANQFTPTDGTPIHLAILIAENTAENQYEGVLEAEVSGTLNGETYSATSYISIASARRGAQGEATPIYEVVASKESVVIPNGKDTANYTGYIEIYEQKGSIRQYHNCFAALYAKKTDGTTRVIVTQQNVHSLGDKDHPLVTSVYQDEDALVAVFSDKSIPSDVTEVEVLAKMELPIVKDGKMGRNFYYAGDWENFNGTFDVTDYEAPYFSLTPSGGTIPNKWVFVGENGTYTKTTAGTPSSTNANWNIMVSDFKYLISEAIFSAFAKLGSGIFNGDYLLSQHGVTNRLGNTYKNFDPSAPTDENFFVPNVLINWLTGYAHFGGNKVQFKADGSGLLADGNIKWDADGNATFNGDVIANNGVFNGFVKKKPFRITSENFRDIGISPDSGGRWEIPFEKIGSFIIFENGWLDHSCAQGVEIALPYYYNPSTQSDYGDKEDLYAALSYVGSTITIVNHNRYIGVTLFGRFATSKTPSTTTTLYTIIADSYQDIAGGVMGKYITMECCSYDRMVFWYLKQEQNLY